MAEELSIMNERKIKLCTTFCFPYDLENFFTMNFLVPGKFDSGPEIDRLQLSFFSLKRFDEFIFSVYISLWKENFQFLACDFYVNLPIARFW